MHCSANRMQFCVLRFYCFILDKSMREWVLPAVEHVDVVVRAQGQHRMSAQLHRIWCLLQASVASIPFIGKITIALQFLFVQRRGSADKNNRYTQAAGQTVEKLAERAADDRRAHCMTLTVIAYTLAYTRGLMYQRYTARFHCQPCQCLSC